MIAAPGQDGKHCTGEKQNLPKDGGQKARPMTDGTMTSQGQEEAMWVFLDSTALPCSSVL